MLPCSNVLIAFGLLAPAFVVAQPHPIPPDPAGVLKQLNFATIGGSQNTIQGIATDSSGNTYVAGTTSAADLTVKNAVQPQLADARIMKTGDLGATWTLVGSPPSDVTSIAADPAVPQVLLAEGQMGIFKSTDAGRTWKQVYRFDSTFSGPTSIAIDPANHLRVAALTPFTEQLIRSADGGETWSDPISPCGSSSCAGMGSNWNAA